LKQRFPTDRTDEMGEERNYFVFLISMSAARKQGKFAKAW
jgi:hypothetical protein